MAEPWKPITELEELTKASTPQEQKPSAKTKRADKPGTLRCTLCDVTMSDDFCTVNGQLACTACAAIARDGKPIQSALAYKQGLVFGIGAALVGLIVYATFTIFTHIYLGYVSLAVGWLVGKAMMRGSNGIGGRRYQIAAVVLTYAAMSLAAVPIRIAMFAPATDYNWSGEAGRLVLWGLLAPLLDLGRGLPGILGLVSLAIGARVAWRLTAARPVVVDGPHQILM